MLWAVICINDKNIDIKENDFETVITVVFSELPHSIMIDSAVKTSLADEYMLNADDDDLEIVKKYKNAGIPKVFIKAVHPTNQKCSNLFLKKNIELKKIIHDNNVPCANYSINATMRKAGHKTAGWRGPFKPRQPAILRHALHSTVTLLARFLGLSTSRPRATLV